MRKTLISFCASIAIISANAQDVSYEVSGIMPDSIKKVYIFALETKGNNKAVTFEYNCVDSADVAGGKFIMKGKCCKLSYYQVGVPRTSGWKGEYHKKYGIKTIPANLLIGPNGRIIACDLRAAKLSSTLEKIFENK